MPTLAIRLTKKTDGSSVLACTRPDGSVTWHRYRQPFYALHDLTHFAVESVLGLRHGFYGLLASGWNIIDFGDRALNDAERPDATLAEGAAGLLDQERGTGRAYDADTFNAMLTDMLAAMHAPHDRLLTDAELDAIRARVRDLTGRWLATPPGEALTLAFDLTNR